MRIDQFLPTFLIGDAIGNQTLEIRRVLREAGYQSDIFAVDIHKKLITEAKPYTVFTPPKTGYVAIYHYSIGSPLTGFVAGLGGTKVFYYHNITPAHFFLQFDSTAYQSCENGRMELAKYHAAFDFSLGASEYNLQEIESLGYPKGMVVPYILNFSIWGRNGQPRREDLLLPKPGPTHILFVGRIVPNKRYEDLIKVFYYYKKTIDPDAHLWLVGPYGTRDRYYLYLRKLIQVLNVDNVHFTGHVSREDGLSEYFKRSSVFLCMSEHEGFCIPLLEAMYFDLPVIAFHAAAVPDTMAEAGLLLNRKEFQEIAELVRLVSAEGLVRQTVLNAQTGRLQNFRQELSEAIFKDTIQEILQKIGKKL